MSDKPPKCNYCKKVLEWSKDSNVRELESTSTMYCDDVCAGARAKRDGEVWVKIEDCFPGKKYDGILNGSGLFLKPPPNDNLARKAIQEKP